jgi:hypothetical protein
MAFEAISPMVKIPDHFKHKGTNQGIAVETRGAGRRLIPVASGPDGAIGCNGQMLRNIAPLLFLRMKPPHRFDSVEAPVLAVIRAPGMVHMDGVNAPPEGETGQEIDKLIEAELVKRLWHNHLRSQSCRWSPPPWPAP